MKRAVFVLSILLCLLALASSSAVVLAQSGGNGSSTSTIPAVTPSSDMLAGLAGAALSLIFSLIPGLNTKFAALPPETKRLIMVGLLLLAAIAVYALGCALILSTSIACDRGGAIQLAWYFVLAVMANQGTFQLTPQPVAVKVARAVSKAKVTPTLIGPG